jgi:hypothetical protein
MPTLQLSARVRQNFLAKRLGHESVGDRSLYCIEQRCRYTWRPFRPNSMSIRAIKCEQSGAKETLLFASIKPRKSHLLAQLETFQEERGWQNPG